MEAMPQSMPAEHQAEQPEGAVDQEIAALRARVRALEAELAETHRRANAAIAAVQDRVYWLDRWHVDLNELMRRRSAVGVRAVLRAGRGILRRLRRFTRALR